MLGRMAMTKAALAELRALLGDDAVLASDAARFTYEVDALTLARRPPDVVVLPRSTEEVSAVVRWAGAHALPIVPRGAGTGLAGGATCEQGGVSLSLNRMDRLLDVDASRLLARVQPGLVNLWLSQQLAAARPVLRARPGIAAGQHARRQRRRRTPAAPTASSTASRYNHVLGVTLVLEDGRIVTLGGEAPDAPDSDLLARVRRQRGHACGGRPRSSCGCCPARPRSRRCCSTSLPVEAACQPCRG